MARKKAALKAKTRKLTKTTTPHKKQMTRGKGKGGIAVLHKPASGTLRLPSNPVTEKQTKAQIFAELAENTGLTKAEIKNVFTALENLIVRTLKGRGAGKFVLPFGVKLTRVHKPATKARMGRNPFTGEEIQIAAKPARKSVKATAMKALKEVVLS